MPTAYSADLSLIIPLMFHVRFRGSVHCKLLSPLPRSRKFVVPSRLFAMIRLSAHSINTSACLIIGDEVLNGKIQDTNSNYFAKYCFDLGIETRRVQVVPDEEEDIVETISELARKYDFIVTSGGIGPTHDDITYEAVANAFNLPLQVHQETVERMAKLGRSDFTMPGQEEARTAQLRMATLPTGNNVRYIYTSENLWVPTVAIDDKVYILPGIPMLFKAMLEGIRVEIENRAKADRSMRFYVTTKWPEARMAPYLSKVQIQHRDKGIKFGSYPHMEKNLNTVSIIGPSSHKDLLRDIVKDVEQSLEGNEISAEEEAANSGESYLTK